MDTSTATVSGHPCKLHERLQIGDRVWSVSALALTVSRSRQAMIRAHTLVNAAAEARLSARKRCRLKSG